MPSKRTSTRKPRGPGIGQQLGSIFDQMLNGQAPSKSQIEQVAADMVGKVIGRKVTVEEVQRVRDGDFEPFGDFQPVAEQVRERVKQRAQGRPEFTPEMNAKIEALKEQGRARAVMGFGKDDRLTPEVIKQQFRKLARKYHSDLHGGSDEKMKRLNWANDLLLQSLS